VSFPHFLDGQHKRLLATLAIGFIFIYFWIEGPIQARSTITNLESSRSEFLIPKLISDTPIAEKNEFNLIEDNQPTSPYYGLIGQKTRSKLFSLIADQQNTPSMVKEVAENMLSHATTLLPSVEKTLKTAIDMFYLELHDKHGKLSGLYIESTGLTEQIKGYAGPITLGLTVSPQGKISSVHYISSEETSSYLQHISNLKFYDQFKGLKLNGNSHEIDAVSGATITTEAMARTLSLLLEKATESPLALYLDDDPSGTKIQAKITYQWIIQAAVILLIFILNWQSKYRLSRQQRFYLSTFSIFYIGFFINNSFTYISFLHPFQGVSVSYLVGFYSIFVLLGTIWDNNTYCKFICPYGNFQRQITRFFPKIRHPFFVHRKWVHKFRLILTIILIMGIFLDLQSWSSYELFPDLFGLEIGLHWFWLSLGFIFISSLQPMLWCRLLCPTGEVLDRLSQLVRPIKKCHKK
jgi:NosR/NirI family nitrous oxide reductase transcriptional regulator